MKAFLSESEYQDQLLESYPDAALGNTSVVEFFKMLALHEDSTGVPPQLAVAYHNAWFVNSSVQFPKELRAHGNLLLEGKVPSVVFGKRTVIVGGFCVKDCEFVALHPDLVVGGLFSSVNSAVLVSERVLENFQFIESSDTCITYSAESNIDELLEELFPGDEKKKARYSSTVRSLLRSESLLSVRNVFYKKTTMPAFSTDYKAQKPSAVVVDSFRSLKPSASETPSVFKTDVYIRDSGIQTLSNITVHGALVIVDCESLREISGRIEAESILIENCTSLVEIDAELKTSSLMLQSCANLQWIKTPSSIPLVTCMYCSNISEFTLFYSPNLTTLLAEGSLYHSGQFSSALLGSTNKNYRSSDIFEAYRALLMSSDAIQRLSAQTQLKAAPSEFLEQIYNDLNAFVFADLGSNRDDIIEVIDAIHLRVFREDDESPAVEPSIDTDIETEFADTSLDQLLKVLSNTDASDTTRHSQVQQVILKKFEDLRKTTQRPLLRLTK